MKKIALMLAVVLIGTGCYAKKAAISKEATNAMKTAKNLSASFDNPDFNKAREAMEVALADNQAAAIANTWYEAGMVGYREFTYLNNMQMIGQNVDDMKRGAAVLASYDYWLKADAMGETLVADKKGNMVPTDAKIRKNIAPKMLEYFQRQNLISYGYNFYEQRDYETAFDIFMRHLNMPKLDMMKDPKIVKEMTIDSLYYTYVYYAGRFAYEGKMYDKAIETMNILNSKEAQGVANEKDIIGANEFIYQCYFEQKDTANFVRILQENTNKFPGEPWFLQNLINYYIFSGQKETAIEYLTKAIESEPNSAQYYHIRGNINEDMGLYDAAMADFVKATEIDPTIADAEAGKGRIYYNQAVKINEESAYLMGTEYEKADKEMKALFRQSLPYFEKAHQLDPENRDFMIVLKGLYYRFHNEAGMQDKYDAIVEEMNK